MRGRGFLLGSALGILSAVILIGLVGISGTAAHHIDLIPTSGQTLNSGSTPSSQAVGPTTSLVQPGSQATSQGEPIVAISAGGGSPPLQILTTLVVAIAVGALFYGFYARRLDAE
jgi:ABC-type antimicrobial peptide transport system permease subunit